MSEKNASVSLYGYGLLSAATFVTPSVVNDLSLNFSGSLINQNGISDAPDPGYIELYNSFVVQEFYLSDTLARGADSTYPELTGIEVCVGVDEGFASTATIEYYFQAYQFGAGWQTLANGVQIGAHTDGDQLWMSIYFNPIDISEMADWKFRFGVSGKDVSHTTINQIVDDYDDTTVTIEGTRIIVIPDLSPVPLEEGINYPFTLNGDDYFLFIEPGSGQPYYSAQQGVNKVWYTSPNPLQLQRVKAYLQDGVTPIQDTSREVSLMFRILGSIADGGIDYLGNNYRSVLVRQKPYYLEAGLATKDRYWMSKPNPSKFAVECLYFDIRQNKQPTVIDKLILDPITPGVHAQIYYSNDSDPGKTPDSWDKLIWTHVERDFLLTKRDTYILPSPITANFIKIEFSHLQARYYAPGNFQRPIKYRKHPSWVLDYFLGLYEINNTSDDPFVASTVNVVYDAIDLAYSYYKDDIIEHVGSPTILPDKITEIQQINSVSNKENLVDSDTLQQIKTKFKPFLNRPSGMGNVRNILGQYGDSRTPTNAQNEVITPAVANTSIVSNTDREGLILENNWPIMYFFIKCRHGYREALAKFENDTGYFVGLKQITFLRDQYIIQSDEAIYIESAGDNLNVMSNDFIVKDGSWTIY